MFSTSHFVPTALSSAWLMVIVVKMWPQFMRVLFERAGHLSLPMMFCLYFSQKPSLILVKLGMNSRGVIFLGPSVDHHRNFSSPSASTLSTPKSSSPSSCPQYHSRESRVHKKDKEQDTVDHRQEGKKLAKYRHHLNLVAIKMKMRIILIRAVLMRTMLMKNFRK